MTEKPNNRKVGASITGLKFGMLTVDHVDPRQPDNGNRFYQCKCDCGRWRLCRRDKLVAESGPRSCGCVPRREAGDRAPYPIPLTIQKPGGRLLLPRDPHNGEAHYLEQAQRFAQMFSPRGEASDCTVKLERVLTAEVPTFVLTVTCHADGQEVSLTDNTVRRLFRLMSEKLQHKGRLL